MSPPIDDAAFVRAQYQTEENPRARKSAYAGAEGDDPREFALVAFGGGSVIDATKVISIMKDMEN